MIPPFFLLFVQCQDTQSSFSVDVTLYGLELGLLTMKKGEFSRFLFKPKYAYGDLGCPPHIPPLATVLYEVHVLDFLDSAQVDEFMDLTMVRFNAFIVTFSFSLFVISKIVISTFPRKSRTLFLCPPCSMCWKHSAALATSASIRSAMKMLERDTSRSYKYLICFSSMRVCKWIEGKCALKICSLF